MTRLTSIALASAATVALLSLGACTHIDLTQPPTLPVTTPQDTTAALRNKVDTIVVIYAENRSFDSLYGRFPGANGLSTVLDASGRPTANYIAQKDRNGVPLPTLPQSWGGVTARGVTPVVTQAQSAGLPNQPFSIETAFQGSAGATLTQDTITRDLVHRFFVNQMQIDGGSNDMFAAWTDSGGLTMGHFDTGATAVAALAHQYVLADNFFQGAFGGSFLNHQYLICACAPEYPNADTAAAKPVINELDKDESGQYLPRLTVKASSPASALDGPPSFERSGNITPANYFGDGKFYAVDTMQPPYQPSGNAPLDDSSDPAFANPNKPTTLPPQMQATIGDLLSAKGVSWAWYAGGWNAALADGRQVPEAKRKVIYAENANHVADAQTVDFQAHHQPFNYYAALSPEHADARRVHLQDYQNMVAAAAAGKLPAVSFYKPEGALNQHPGNTNIADGDANIAALVAKLQASPQWGKMVIVITYDEFGGAWDHVAPPKGDLLGPGTRIPAIIISPLAKKGTVDHTPDDTASILRLITRRFSLPTLPGITRRDQALTAAGGRPMGDLTEALNLN